MEKSIKLEASISFYAFFIATVTARPPLIILPYVRRALKNITKHIIS